MQAMKSPVPKSCVKTNSSIRKKLVFSDSICYMACKGYKKMNDEDPKLLPTDISTLSINFGSFAPNTISTANVTAASNHVVLDSDTTNHSSKEDQDSSDSGPESLAKIIDNMAFDFWKCTRCLSMKHTINECTSQIRCRSCFHYGHV